MLISGIIGLGTGLFISGIVLSILVYTVNNKEPVNPENITEAQQGEIQSAKIIEQEQGHTPLEPKETKIELEKTNLESEMTTAEAVTIAIGEAASAREIATILEKQGVVSDSSAFLTYIISQGASRRLQHGQKVFILNSENEDALKVLTAYE